MHAFNIHAQEMAAKMEHELRTEHATHLARLGLVPEPLFRPSALLCALVRRLAALVGRRYAASPQRPRACTPSAIGGRRCVACGGSLIRSAALTRPGRPSRCALRRRRPQLERRW